MKKSLLILLILMATFASLRVYSAVDIPDANLRAALGKGQRTSITESEMRTFYVLDLTRKGIRDLTGLEFARNLQTGRDVEAVI